MSITRRGGSVIVKVVKLGFLLPWISMTPPFTSTRLMVLRSTFSCASAGSERARTAASTFMGANATTACNPANFQALRCNAQRVGLLLFHPRQHRRPRAVRARVLDQVLDVVTDLP